MVFYTRLLPVLYTLRKGALIIPIIFIFYFYIHRSLPDYYKHFNRSTTPLILLFTYNRSIKTRDNICKGTRNGGHIINFDKCPLKCEFSCRIEDFTQRSPQAVLFFGEDFAWPFKLSNKNRSSFDQRWIFWSWEAPVHHSEYTRSGLTFNWTMTYRKDSDIIHDYGRYIPRNLSYTIRDYQAVDFYLSSKDNQSTFHIEKEFENRQNEILWFVSNCKSRTKRDKIADELNKYFSIKQYGQCSQSQKDRHRMSSKEFEQTLFRYKFYLAFENAHCQDYITEKTFYNALAHGSIPIVLGSTKENYEKLLPPNSFIHINHFDNMTQLANELDHISKNLTLFTFYHQWRKNYRLIAWPSNYYIDDLFCNLCIKLHNDKKQKSYENFSKWLNKCK
ncbi:unnamed protein product [Adineta steineri]|uniref:Fucosyltransferase n=1 Tax=Adineta steineri TaxID=433720 RepID=A0A815W4X6_9BILA|nr:unnamed protein product [Adineta steineri]CAF1540693.1 unnamed protein product [Adineta steineri]